MIFMLSLFECIAYSSSLSLNFFFLLPYHCIISRCFFLIIDLCFLIPAASAKIFNLTAELVIPIETPTKEAKAKPEIQPVIIEVTISKFSI